MDNIKLEEFPTVFLNLISIEAKNSLKSEDIRSIILKTWGLIPKISSTQDPTVLIFNLKINIGKKVAQK